MIAFLGLEQILGPALRREAPMIAFLGLEQALALAPLCSDRDLAAWAGTQRAVRSALMAEPVWRLLVAQRLRPALDRLAEAAPEGKAPESPEAVVAQLSSRPLCETYAQVRRTSLHPFILDPRSRLLLEIHELRDWDRYKSLLLIHRQAQRLAIELGRLEEAEAIRAGSRADILELISLQAMMGGGGVATPPRMFDNSGLEWSEQVDADLRLLLEKRLQGRRLWWQRQREYLLQDLEWH